MLDTTEIEYHIFGCIFVKPTLLDDFQLDERYFKLKDILKYTKDIYRKYKTLDPNIFSDYGKNEKALNFCIKVSTSEPTATAITGYYKKLKEVYRNNKIIEYTEKYKTNKIDLKEFSNAIEYFSKVEDFEEDEILTVDNISQPKGVEREYTNIKELDYLLKGIEYGKLSLWSGITNHGKTTLMIQFAKECINGAKKIFYFSGEQSAEEFKNYLYVGMCKKEQLEFITDNHNSRIYDTKPKDDVIKYLDDLYKDYVFIYNNNIPENNIDTMIRVMTKANSKGVRIFFIDNFMQLDNSEKLDEQTRIVEKFKKFARNNNCIVNLVAHPRKTQFQRNRLNIFDISGTQNIANKSSNICTIIRTDLLPEKEKDEIGEVLAKNGYDINECSSIVEVLKTKGNSCKMVGLKYDFERKIYFEANKSQMNNNFTKR